MSLGVVLLYLMLRDPAFGAGTAAFSLPWLRLGVIILAAQVAAVLMTYLKTRQAGRVPMAEALRFDQQATSRTDNHRSSKE